MADAGIITITSFISPYAREREFARTLHKGSGLGFVEVYIKASLETCENRDPKGLYRKARSGQLKNFTGIDDPYEPPLCPELIAETEKYSPEELADQIVRYLLDANYLQSEDRRRDLDEAWTLLTSQPHRAVDCQDANGSNPGWGGRDVLTPHLDREHDLFGSTTLFDSDPPSRAGLQGLLPNQGPSLPHVEIPSPR